MKKYTLLSKWASEILLIRQKKNPEKWWERCSRHLTPSSPWYLYLIMCHPWGFPICSLRSHKYCLPEACVNESILKRMMARGKTTWKSSTPVSMLASIMLCCQELPTDISTGIKTFCYSRNPGSFIFLSCAQTSPLWKRSEASLLKAVCILTFISH